MCILSDVVKGCGNRIGRVAFNDSQSEEPTSENLIFFSNSELLEDYPDQTRSVQVAILTELLVRYSFKPSDAELRNNLCNILSEEPVSNFETWLDNHAPCYVPKPISLVSPHSRLSIDDQAFVKLVEYYLFIRLEKLYGKCDGLLPLVLKIEKDGSEYEFGLALPFTLEYFPDCNSTDFVVDMDDVPFQEWSEAISKLSKSFIRGRYRLRLLFQSSIIKDDVPFSDSSLQFPFLLAYWRKTHLLPTYSPFSIIATGAISADRLRPVITLPKIKSIKEQYDLLTFICPFSSDIAADPVPDPTLTVIDANTSIDDIRSLCQNKIEKFVIDRSSRSIFLDSDYIYNRIDDIVIYTKDDLESRWEQIIASLHHIERSLRDLPGKDENAYLDCLMSLSFAYCHCGMTDEAIKYNTQGSDYAEEHNLIDKLNWLSIHQLVLLQDIDDLSSVPELSKVIELQLSRPDIDQATRVDLLMRYHGSMAQIHIYGTLAGLDGFSQEKAFENVTSAIEYAKNTGKVEEIVRDYNYRHLWYAIFKPGSEEERSDFDFANGYLQTNSGLLGDKLHDINLQFQFRQRCLAAYFQILRENQCNDNDILNKKFPVIDEPFNWLKALSNKYQGAVNAFYHNKEKAQKLFDEAIEMLENDASPLFRFICMTIAAEAYRSFSVLGDVQTAQQYRDKALEIYTKNGNFITFRISSPRWSEFLNTPWEEFQASGKDFPGLHYYY